VLLPLSSYIDAANKIRKGADAVYPFTLGNFSLKTVYLDKDARNMFLKNFDIDFLDIFFSGFKSINHFGHASFGFCTFYNRKSYISGFMENENFLSWGPEDQEIAYRFEKLDFTIERVNNFIYHLEHDRTKDSGRDNPFFEKNNEIYDNIMSMNKNELQEYYQNQKYYVDRMKKHENRSN
jgi:hypothetical protein